MDKPEQPLEIGEIMQIGPTFTNAAFHYAFMVVTESKEWGAVGYGEPVGPWQVVRADGIAYVHVPWADMEPTGGKAVWRAAD